MNKGVSVERLSLGRKEDSWSLGVGKVGINLSVPRELGMDRNACGRQSRRIKQGDSAHVRGGRKRCRRTGGRWSSFRPDSCKGHRWVQVGLWFCSYDS